MRRPDRRRCSSARVRGGRRAAVVFVALPSALMPARASRCRLAFSPSPPLCAGLWQRSRAPRLARLNRFSLLLVSFGAMALAIAASVLLDDGLRQPGWPCSAWWCACSARRPGCATASSPAAFALLGIAGLAALRARWTPCRADGSESLAMLAGLRRGDRLRRGRRHADRPRHRPLPGAGAARERRFQRAAGHRGRLVLGRDEEFRFTRVTEPRRRGGFSPQRALGRTP